MNTSIQQFLKSKKFLWLIIGLGIVLRLVQYLFNRSLWLDEAALASSIISRDFAGLLQPLDFAQTAPVGFLMLTRLAVEVGGGGEYVLRFIPFISGILALFIFWKVTELYVTPRAVPFALGLFAISTPLIYFSSELKQYSTEVLAALLLFWLVGQLRTNDRPQTLSFIGLAATGAAAVWFSFSTIFVLAGTALGMIFFAWTRKQKKMTGWLTLTAFIWAASFVAYYFLLLKKMIPGQAAEQYWETYFMPFPPLSLEQIKWYTTTFFRIFEYPGGLKLTGLAALCFICGCYSLFQKQKEKLSFLILPIFVTLFASTFHKYPFGGRLILFLAPVLILGIAQGIVYIQEKLGSTNRVIYVLIIVFLFLQPGLSAGQYLMKPRTVQEIRPVVEYLAQHKQNDDLVYVYYGAEKGFAYYAPRFHLNPQAAIPGIKSRQEWDNYRTDINKLTGHNRVWLLFSHVHSDDGVNEEKFFTSHLDRAGQRLDFFRASGGSLPFDEYKDGPAVYLYDLSKGKGQ